MNLASLLEQANLWFKELNEVIEGLFYLVVTTWGGGARGTEMQLLCYANRQGRKRDGMVMNGLFTIMTEYSKQQSIRGSSKVIARTPAFQVSRLLVLVLCSVHYAAGYISCFMGMAKADCSRYFYEFFVLSGRPMSTKNFTDTLGRYNSITTGIDLKLADFRQFMACIIISSTLCGFIDPTEEDDNVRAAHESFNHSVKMGQTNYGLQDVGDATTLAPETIANMQQVSLRWQAFLRLVHPVIHAELDLPEVLPQPGLIFIFA